MDTEAEFIIQEMEISLEAYKETQNEKYLKFIRRFANYLLYCKIYR